MDARDIINAWGRAQLADNSDRFLALSSVFDNIEYPKDFKPMNIQKYDGKQNPAQWLRLYSTAASVAGGDTKVIYFPMAQEPVPLTWLENLARESIHSWDDLKKAFIDNFQGSLHRVATRHTLYLCKQEQGESIRSYVKCFFDTRATIPNVADDDVIDYFQSSITVQSLYRDFGHNRPKMVVDLCDMMQRWADEEEQECIRFPRRNNDNNGKRHNDRGGPSNQRDLMRRIPLVAGPSTVVVALPIIIIVAAGKATAFLLLFICPALHHVS